jgi:enoyl-CoA hydratase
MKRTLFRSVTQTKFFFSQIRNKSWDIKPYVYNNEDAALIVTMNSNPVNSINPQYMQDMRDTIDTLNRDYGDLKHAPVLLQSHSARTFSAGLDLHHVTTELGQDKKKIKTFVNDLNEMFTSWYMLDRPTVAIVNGHCIAGGLVTALCCDFRVASNDTRPDAKQPLLTLREVFLGLNFPGATFEILRSQFPTSDQLYQATMTGRTYTPKEAHEYQIVNKLVNVDDTNATNVNEHLYKAAMSLINDRIDTKLSNHAYITMKKVLKEAGFKANGYQHKNMDRTFIELMASQPVQDRIQSVLGGTKKK